MRVCEVIGCKEIGYNGCEKYCHDHKKEKISEKNSQLIVCQAHDCFVASQKVEKNMPQPIFCPVHMAATSSVKTAPKENILQEADRLTSSDRAKAYGPPKENFGKIATMWSAYKGVDFSERDIAMMMILVKVARDSYKPKRDSLVDIAGYARTGEMIDE